MKQKLISTFTGLIAFNTQSDPNSNSFPSTEFQIYFAEMLAQKCAMLELENVVIDKYCYVSATLPSNTDIKTPTIGFIAHIDTSPDCSGANIKPNIVETYDGNNIKLRGITLSPTDFPTLKNYIGKTIITTDGTTLLGADDKAGIAEIFTAIEYLIAHPEIPHGDIRIAFTPDEEIGAGADHFDVEKFNCDFAYTIDGGILGEISYENFNAARAKIDITGKSVHPGSAKDTMINASLVAMEIGSMLPSSETPTNTEGYEGFYHLTRTNGSVEHAHLDYIIRDFDKSNFEKRKSTLTNIVKEINNKYGANTATLDIYDEYLNMCEVLEKNKEIVDRAINAITLAGVKPLVEPIRGGTDGARLSFMGLPCPNIFTGGHNFHGPYEYICVESMIKAVETIINIVDVSKN